ncbi:GNAT family N-acetyltransferase [Solwaraspora sp. WMMD1047]|uniref:GNAT family N-acetyltransferase n=1 Tax=Solwaraspora sp. WMMD1047 TaxID=3016102 RepID=UPI00241784C7|nr:GNAT family N-acetyltransferase [Solwaraspora sp. WMMD1047]MDG4833701.1 GNAT family N-acetyltransferase [Solwaraspora sp. WMMD1047]
MDVAVTALDPTDPVGTEHAYKIKAACTAADMPDFPPTCREFFFGNLRHPWPGDQPRYALAHLDGVPVGLLEIELPQLENTDNAPIDIYVLPEFQRRGVGRFMFEHALDVVRGLGRKRVFGMTVTALPDGPPRPEPGTRFAQAMGMKSALVDVRRRLDTTSLDEAGLDRLLTASWQHAEGYSAVRWYGAAPQEYLDDVAYLDSRLLSDAPMGDLDWEPDKTDAARVRAIEAARDARGRRAYHAGVVHDASGRLVAWTTIDVNASQRWHAFQQITLVEPTHRGHRLGTIVKIENLRHAMAGEPELRAIDTWNAAENQHMIAINEAIGFRARDGWHNWQLNL